MAEKILKFPKDERPTSIGVIAEYVPVDNVDIEGVGHDIQWALKQWKLLRGDSSESLPQWDEMTQQTFLPVSRRFMVVLAHGDWRKDEFDVIYTGQHVADFLNQGKPVRFQRMRKENPDFEGNYQDVKARLGRAMDNQEPELVVKRMDWADMHYISYQSLALPFLCGDKCSYVINVLEFKLSVEL